MRRAFTGLKAFFSFLEAFNFRENSTFLNSQGAGVYPGSRTKIIADWVQQRRTGQPGLRLLNAHGYLQIHTIKHLNDAGTPLPGGG